jgi:hypothetical protein
MSRSSEWRPRLNVDITPEQDTALKRYVPHGLKTVLFSVLIEELVEMLKEDAPTVISLVLKRKMTAKDLLED